ncbi:hypothetical protein JCM1841_003177 [Sporobolomyces salmonicolor]
MASQVNAAKQHLARTPVSARSASSAFFPVQSSPSPSTLPIRPTLKPPSALWYTARPSLSATLTSLDETLTRARVHLFRQGLLPSISAPIAGARAEFGEVLPHPRLRRWKNAKEMATYLRNGTSLKTNEYKRLTAVLANLEGLLPYAQVADSVSSDATSAPSLVVDPVALSTHRAASPEDVRGAPSSSLHSQLEGLLARFQQAPAVSSTGVTVARVSGKDRRLGSQDALARTYAVGRRKESSARVWIVPAALAQDDAASSSCAADAALGRVLVNTLALPAYFSQPTLRTAVVRPFALTSSLGAFNVFAIVKGGGIAAQADAVAMGIARALAEWERCEVEAGRRAEAEESWRDVLKRAELIDRDPRMVERKKTGQVKARKKWTWVKR